MALTDNAVVIPGKGHFLTAATTATKPTLAQIVAFANNTTTTPTGFDHLGHSDIDEVLSFGQEGGETETKGSWQNPSLREATTSVPVDYLVAKSLQVRDNAILTLYYGGGNASVVNEFSLPDTSVPVEKSLLLVMVDAVGPLGLYIKRASIRREDAIEVASDDFVKLPLRFTFLQASGSPKATWIGQGLGAAA